MDRFKCVYYQTVSGRLPVKEFIDSLHMRTQQKYFEVVKLLEDYGQRLPFPHSDYLGGDIYELRFVGAEGQVRILYFFFDQAKIILTNGFVKKTQRTPRKELTLAKERRNVYLQRHIRNL